MFQAVKTRPLTLHFDLAPEFKQALDSAIKMDNKALTKHVKVHSLLGIVACFASLP